jgi:uncharacterized protein with FMN-binding domain
MNTLPPPHGRPIDPVLASRLDRLQQRRAGVSVTAPDPTTKQPATRHTAMRHPATTRPGRRHPAEKSRVTALAMSVATTVGLATYFSRTASPTLSTATAPAATNDPPTATPAPTVAAAAVASTTTTAPVAHPVTTATTPTAATTVQSVTGQTALMKYGPIQVAITVAAGQITDVTTLQQPTDRKSTRINSSALPELASEAVTAQSANVHVVSGATYTSDAYRQSLQSAIDTARSSGLLEATS